VPSFFISASFIHTAFFVFLPAATGARVIAHNFRLPLSHGLLSRRRYHVSGLFLYPIRMFLFSTHAKIFHLPKKNRHMPREDLHPLQLNLQLKKAFEKLGLDPAPVLDFTPLDLDLENRRLENLRGFTLAYQQLGGREQMEAVHGKCTWPPIIPGIDPESDWYRFERWVRGEPVREPIANQFSLHEKFRPATEVPEAEIEAETQRLIDLIEATGNGVSLRDGIPAHLVYKNLLEWIGEPHELSGLGGGGWFYDGCSGYCPGCFQRPWCETGNSSCWTEDEKAGKIHYTEELQPYVSASPQSLAIISKLQKEHDESMKKWMEKDDWKNNGPYLDHEGLREYDGEGDLPF
jgi:hypothetical protein